MLEKLFKLRENGTDVRTEVMAGITTFMTMAYILAVNPNILSATGMDSGAVFTATALAAFIGTLLMAFLPTTRSHWHPEWVECILCLYSCYRYGIQLAVALTAVFVEGIVFIVLSLTNVREAIFNAIPKNLKSAVSVGIGLFIAFIGLQNANIVDRRLYSAAAFLCRWLQRSQGCRGFLQQCGNHRYPGTDRYQKPVSWLLRM